MRRPGPRLRATAHHDEEDGQAMKSSSTDREVSPGAPRTCTWCKEPFRSRAEQELHVSLLGAPGEFHRACYEEYLQTDHPGS